MKNYYSKGIDILRALAIVSVIFYHLPEHSFKGGLQGVTIFFVISGFLMAKVSEKSRFHTLDSFFCFYTRRIKRIYPFMLWSLLITLVVVGSLNVRLIGNIRNELSSLLLGFNNWWQLKEGVSYFDTYKNASLFKHYWSLAVELQFYFLWPFLSLLLKKMKKHGDLLLLLLISLSLMSHFWLPSFTSYYNTFSRLFAFLFGVLAYRHADKLHYLYRRNLRLKFWFTVTLLLLLLAFPLFSFTLTATAISILTSVLLALLIHPEFEQILGIGHFHLSFIGKISFELYLIHFPFLIVWANYQRTISYPSLFLALSLLFMLTIFSILLFNRFSFKRYKLFYASLLAISLCFIWIAPENRLTNDQLELAQLLKQNKQQMNTPSSEKTKEPSDKGTSIDGSVLFLGDSVMLGAYQELEDTYAGHAKVDAKESRQFSRLPDILQQYSSLDTYSSVVIGLGTNGSFSNEMFEQVHTLLKDKKIYLITVRGPIGWQEVVNEQLISYSHHYENVTLLDWFSASKEHPEYFYDDGTHLNGAGRKAYAAFISNAVS